MIRVNVSAAIGASIGDSREVSTIDQNVFDLQFRLLWWAPGIPVLKTVLEEGATYVRIYEGSKVALWTSQSPVGTPSLSLP